MDKYIEQQRLKAVGLIKNSASIFEGADGGKRFLRSDRDFVLKQSDKNLYISIRDEAKEYFFKNHISWWNGRNVTGHTLSSQVACVNHLFALRNDETAIKNILKGISQDFVRPHIINSDKFSPAFIQFEAVSDGQYLNEGGLTRGTQCTSVDALMYAEHKDGSLWLIPIEWKYTESYGNQDKANEGKKANPERYKGKERQNRYNELIKHSSQLRSDNTSHFYYEPFYQLMRQTVLAEQMIKHKNQETVKADNFLHLHVIPKGNNELLNKKYSCSNIDMETTWRNTLVDQSKYKIMSPEELLKPISDMPAYDNILAYLNTRYWE